MPYRVLHPINWLEDGEERRAEAGEVIDDLPDPEPYLRRGRIEEVPPPKPKAPRANPSKRGLAAPKGRR